MRILIPTCEKHREVVAVCRELCHIHHFYIHQSLCDSENFVLGDEKVDRATFLGHALDVLNSPN